MEDRHVTAAELRGDPAASLYAVFDGHAGALASSFCAERVVGAVLSDPNYPARPVQALTSAFLKMDAEFLEYARAARPPLDDGTTALAMLAMGNTLYVANAGDSRALLVQKGGRIEPLSEDHKPNRPDEIARIKAAGGTVYFHGVWRVGGLLAVSRAIGDRILKPAVTARPDIRKWTVTPADAAVVLASDGLWDVYSNAEVGSIVVSAGGDMKKAATQLVSGALMRGSADNITAVVIDLTRPRDTARQVAVHEAMPRSMSPGPIPVTPSHSSAAAMPSASAMATPLVMGPDGGLIESKVEAPGSHGARPDTLPLPGRKVVGHVAGSDHDAGQALSPPPSAISVASPLGTGVSLDTGSSASAVGGGLLPGLLPGVRPSHGGITRVLPWAVTYPVRLVARAALGVVSPAARLLGLGTLFKRRGSDVGELSGDNNDHRQPMSPVRPVVASSSATMRTLAQARRRTASASSGSGAATTGLAALSVAQGLSTTMTDGTVLVPQGTGLVVEGGMPEVPGSPEGLSPGRDLIGHIFGHFDAGDGSGSPGSSFGAARLRIAGASWSENTNSGW